MWTSSSWTRHQSYVEALDRANAFVTFTGRPFIESVYPREFFIMRILNLDPVGPLIAPLYSNTVGAPAKNQMQVLRSLILFGLTIGTTPAKTSLTKWVNLLHKNTPLTFLAGCFSPDQIPSLGSHYAFIDRLWASNEPLLTRADLLLHNKDEFRRGRPDIGGDGKAREDNQEKNTEDAAAAILQGRKPAPDPEVYLQKILSLTAVATSISYGLIQPANCILSGDGTVIHAHASPYGHHDRSLPPDSSFRHFSDPDADWGYDSDLEQKYYGHTLYLFNYRNDDLKVELPVSFKYTSARRHDALNFLFLYSDFRNNDPLLFPDRFCLDSAHDNYPTYNLLKHDGIIPVIDLNMKSPLNADGLPEGFTYDTDGNIRCRCNARMHFSQFDSVKRRNKYRCPFACGEVDSCPYREQCQKKVTNYGRSIYVPLPDDIRFNPGIPRNSDEWKDTYRQRTASERINNRILNDYMLSDMKIHSTRRYAFFTMVTCIILHMVAIYNFFGSASV